MPDQFRILVCEDDESLLIILRYHLRMDGVELVFTEDGKKGVKALNELPAFDLVISDLLMPEMNGIDFIRYIRDVLKLKIPIIVISSDDNINEIREAYDIGIDDFVAKPFNPREIALRVETLLRKTYPERFLIIA